MNVFIVIGRKTHNAEPECLYIGTDGVKAKRAGDAACESGEYVNGKLGKVVHPSLIPLPTVPKTAPKVEAVNTKKKTTK